MTEGLPTKNTFIHFNEHQSHGWYYTDSSGSKDESSSGQRLVYWLPSISSSEGGQSVTGSRRRAASSDGGRSFSSGEGPSKEKFLAHRTTKQQIDRAKATLGMSSLPAAPSASAKDATSSTSTALPASSSTLTQANGKGLCSAATHTWQRSNLRFEPVAVPKDAPPEPEVVHLLKEIPLDESGNLTSLGSLHHKEGECSPCQFWFKGVCINSLACDQCHFAHEGQRLRRLRPSKQGRLRMKKRCQQEGDGQHCAFEACNVSELAAKLSHAAEVSGLKVAPAPDRERKKSVKMSL